jgi:osmotically-inducible protein OsmY
MRQVAVQSVVKQTVRFFMFLAIVLTVIPLTGCPGAKYKAMADAAQSELSPMTLARDDRHKIQLHQALVVDQGFSGLLSVYVFMDRAYLVGRVDGPEQADALLRTARTAAGIRSVEGYLPVKQPAAKDNTEGSTASDVTLKTQIKAALALEPEVVTSRVNIEVLDGQAVLLGVVSGDNERLQAERAAAGVDGVKGLTNWLLLPESKYQTIRPRLR